jgi:hypothetical protein
MADPPRPIHFISPLQIERGEVESIVGVGLLEDNQALFEELSALLEIFSGLTMENDQREAT